MAKFEQDTYQPLAITGHRPHRLGDFELLKQELKRFFILNSPRCVIQGMAQGADLLAAQSALELGVPLYSVRPWNGHTGGESIWEVSQWTHVVSESYNYPGPHVYFERNQYMVDRCARLLAIWDRGKTGGTYATVQYARQNNVPVDVLDPKSLSVTAL